MFVKRLIFFTILIISVLIINNLGQSIYSLWQKKAVIVNVQQELDNEKKENLELKKKLAEVKKPQFVEEEARNKLFLAKPGEEIVLLPTGSIKQSKNIKSSSKDARSNWEKWWDLFF